MVASVCVQTLLVKLFTRFFSLGEFFGVCVFYPSLKPIGGTLLFYSLRPYYQSHTQNKIPK